METKKLQVLFVGNSYTYYYDMPQTFFTDMAAKVGYDAEVTSITAGGYFLSQYVDPEDAEGQRLRAAISGKRFDCVVLQEQSTNAIEDEERFFFGVQQLMELIDADRYILYATWGRNDGSKDLVKLGLTRQEMTEKLSAAYGKAAKRYGAEVAEVGKAFWEYSLTHDKDELYNPDMSHPSALGSEIAARVILEQVLA